MFAREKVGAHTFQIRTGYGVCVYYVEGRDKGLLIDTGYGIGSLREFLSSFSRAPYDVLLTHGHGDHVGGAGEFERVYLPSPDEKLLKTYASAEFRKELLSKKYTFSGELMPEKPDGYLELGDGMEFDLGGIHVKIVSLPGHTQGCIVPVVAEDNLAILGDAAGENTMLCFPESASVALYEKGLNRFIEKTKGYNIRRYLRFHGTCESELPLIADLIRLCERIRAGKDEAVPVNVMGQQAFMAKERDDATLTGNILYRSKAKEREQLE